jgi:hypothetical protein
MMYEYVEIVQFYLYSIQYILSLSVQCAVCSAVQMRCSQPGSLILVEWHSYSTHWWCDPNLNGLT